VGEDLNVTFVNEFDEEYRLDGTATDPGVSAVVRQNLVHVEVFEDGGWHLALNVDTTVGQITIHWEDDNEWGYEALSTDCGGPYEEAAIVRNDGPGGVVEGNFEGRDLGYSCEGPEMTVRGSFRACVEAP
jgi:hypothetical protein